MLFNSYEYILYFLPSTVFLFYLLAQKVGQASSIWMLVIASLFFYGWWNWRFLPLLVGSLCGNYLLAQAIYHYRRLSISAGRVVLGLGITANLFLLAYFKYSNFFIASLAELGLMPARHLDIVLPLAISFFTF